MSPRADDTAGDVILAAIAESPAATALLASTTTTTKHAAGTAKSGWCLVRGSHTSCRYAKCACPCHTEELLA